jgi:hypothetical protein
LANLPEVQARVTEITRKAMARVEQETELTVARMMKEAAGIATAHVEDIK